MHSDTSRLLSGRKLRARARCPYSSTINATTTSGATPGGGNRLRRPVRRRRKNPRPAAAFGVCDFLRSTTQQCAQQVPLDEPSRRGRLDAAAGKTLPSSSAWVGGPRPHALRPSPQSPTHHTPLRSSNARIRQAAVFHPLYVSDCTTTNVSREYKSTCRLKQ